MKTEKQLLSEANDILRSLYGVIKSKGQENYNWEALESKVKAILGEQHEYLLDTLGMFKEISNRKPFYVSNVRDVLDLQKSGEISFSKMVELLNDIARESKEQGCRIVASKVMCSLCGNDWIALRPDGVDKLECKHCKIISTVQRVV